MIAEEKWQRLNNPTCVEDYGLSMGEAEMRQFPEGRAILASLKRDEQSRSILMRRSAEMADAAAKRIDDIILAVFTND